MKKNGNTLFVKDGYRMFGSRFGWAIIYRIVSSKYDILKVKINRGRILPEDVMHTQDETKFDLVVGCVYELMKFSQKNIILSIYGKEIRFDYQSDRDKAIISREIRKLQRSMISIDESVDAALRREISNSIDKILSTIDIY